ncbi:MAG TPA: hypothetical protein VG013_28740 [Gemmataceae bacterium]|jgi:hypothetical protein|nr:hypothetical protein [Gemmataceae bacterium]
MATKESNQRVLIGLGASNLAFRIGQAIQRGLILNAMLHATARNSGTVSADDVVAALAEFDVAATCKAAGVVVDGRAREGGSDAA